MSASPTTTLRQRKPVPPPGAPPPPQSGQTPAKPAKSVTSSVFAVLYLIVAVAGVLSLAGAAAAYLYYLNPGDYFRPTPTPPWISSPDSEPWTVDFTPDLQRRGEIVRAFQHAWSAYERDAMGCDEYHPVARKGSNLTSAGGIGYMVTDSLDTMMLMGLGAEYSRAKRWIEDQLDFDRDAEVSTFETTIRVLGGLLSAYNLASTNEDSQPFIRPTDATLFLGHAQSLGARLSSAFSSATGLPFTLVNLRKRVGAVENDNRGLISTAEAATLQLEFRYLSWALGEEDFLDGKEDVKPVEYWEKAERVMKIIRGARANGGLAPIFMSLSAGKFVSSDIRLGSRGDSYYEYLLKQYLQTASTEAVYADMYATAMDGIHQLLLVNGPRTGMLFTQEVQPKRNAQGGITWVRIRKQDHLVCFLGGNLLLGAVRLHSLVDEVSIPPKEHELSPTGRRDWTTGINLIETCMDTYRTKTGLSPEIIHFRESIDTKRKKKNDKSDPEEDRDWFIKGSRPTDQPPVYDARYILRPETIESLFIAYRLTGNPRYRTYAYDIFQAIQRHCKVPGGGYAGVKNVEDELSGRPGEEHRWEDKMETFLLSETLKYLYLIFSDDRLLPLDEYVFNTEAHPLPIFEPTAGLSGMHMQHGQRDEL
ncbi:alpha-1,2-Mannosidase [Mycena kentingensis (nom. inval.)]|nr:alpha-1,2-Mannosidase [Mycena kentingensis (nom. inval.)]